MRRVLRRTGRAIRGWLAAIGGPPRGASGGEYTRPWCERCDARDGTTPGWVTRRLRPDVHFTFRLTTNREPTLERVGHPSVPWKCPCTKCWKWSTTRRNSNQNANPRRKRRNRRCRWVAHVPRTWIVDSLVHSFVPYLGLLLHWQAAGPGRVRPLESHRPILLAIGHEPITL